MNLAGRVRLRPGGTAPAIQSDRPLLATRLARGRPAKELPDTLAAVFALCAHAHRATSRRAIAAARGDAAPAQADEHRSLQLDTAREHVMRIAHDWHALLPGAPAPEPALRLRENPLWQPALGAEAQATALPQWLARDWLGMTADDWLAQHRADPLGHAARWCEQADTPLAHLLRSQRAPMQAIATPSRPLRLLEAPGLCMPQLAARMHTEPDFCARPDWQGEPAETGPWTRAIDPPASPLHNVWMRFVARLVDLLELALPQGAERLARGALSLGCGEGIAWTEMARGLLVHWVRLDDATDGERVADCRVLAPTEWNFHPQGILARALAGLHGESRADQAARAAVAFDPCVAFEVDAVTEAPHA